VSDEFDAPSTVLSEEPTSESKKILRHKIKTLFGIVPGCAMQLASIFIYVYVLPPSTLQCSLILLAGTVLFVWGCYHYAKIIGHHGAWGLLGIGSLFGALVLATFPDLTEIDPMSEQYSQKIFKRNTLLGTISGLVLQFSAQLVDFPSTFSFLRHFLILAGIGAFVWGCCYLAKYKGCRPGWGLLGFAGLMGALALLMFPESQPNRSKTDVLLYLQRQAKTGLAIAVVSPIIALVAAIQFRGLGAPDSAARSMFWICLLICYILSVWGCSCWLERKGYENRMWAALALLTVPGWLIILILPDRNKTVDSELAASLKFFQREVVKALVVLVILGIVPLLIYTPMYISRKRVVCDRKAWADARELAQALQKFSAQVREFRCEEQLLPPDFLGFIVGPYYGWKGTDAKSEVLVRIEGDLVFACSRRGTHPGGPDTRYIYRVNFVTGKELPAIIGDCKGKSYLGEICYSESVLDRDCSLRKPHGRPCK